MVGNGSPPQDLDLDPPRLSLGRSSPLDELAALHRIISLDLGEGALQGPDLDPAGGPNYTTHVAGSGPEGGSGGVGVGSGEGGGGGHVEFKHLVGKASLGGGEGGEGCERVAAVSHLTVVIPDDPGTCASGGGGGSLQPTSPSVKREGFNLGECSWAGCGGVLAGCGGVGYWPGSSTACLMS